MHNVWSTIKTYDISKAGECHPKVSPQWGKHNRKTRLTDDQLLELMNKDFKTIISNVFKNL